MTERHRVSIGVDPGHWTSDHTDRFCHLVLTQSENETFSKVRATMIFYTLDPDGFMKSFQDAFEFCDIRWINLSEE